MPALRCLDRIYVADDVGDSHVGRRQLFDKTRVARNPADMSRVAMQFDHLSPVSANRLKGIVVDFRTGNDRNCVVEQIGQLANYPALCLPAQAQQNQIMARQNRVDELRDHGLIIANHAGKKSFARL